MVPQKNAIVVVQWGLSEGYPCPDFCLHLLTRFNKYFADSGLGMAFKFQRFQLALGFVFEQPIQRGMLLSKWATN